MIPSKTIFSRYFDIFAASDFDYTKIGHRVEIPKFSRLILSNLLNQSKEKFQKESTLLRIDGEVLIIGDLHGNILDLLRILNAHFYTHDKFLFIGDFVDRGDFSIEVISLLLALTIEHPTRFFLIRGNHEFQEINRKYGFYDEIMTEYKDESLFNKFNDVFNYLPIAAIVNSVNFCVHGGIAETLKNVSQIERLERPIVDFSKQMIRDMMWSDPFDSDSSMYGIGERGKGCCYSYIACRIFFNDNPPLQKIIRGHECVNHGIKLSCSNKVIM
ncbi:Serine/threonine-protein phosphatase PP1 [Tritrichomonas foetus]|uniref:Serine/threonine-protein phosphatase n=1 Tax=Tritrichomonas foetus TaxID=1144522 RepID=A0A1J4JLJ3_9EUKA|nr:Serine/threonine-protein phosphatase PP1 [Tritrichomonas foetus]|eukprot:OHS98140.1 Serine/threonine-protein phosphatase PP1 [Tritrichomonas foetus]